MPKPKKNKAANPVSTATPNSNDNGESASELPADAGGRPTIPSAADQQALTSAMSRLEVIAGAEAALREEGRKRDKKTAAVVAALEEKEQAMEEKEKLQEKEKEKVARKIKAEDVGLLKNQLDLNDIQAKELLKTHDTNLVTAIRAFIAPPKVT
ncbi:hypothetical protein FQN53_002840 [Emmonsiellopsis sp. PD_33]|nr:hypothetical protein FQN53_002840 [Emmonsiellopsis sp. PD_33]